MSTFACVIWCSRPPNSESDITDTQSRYANRKSYITMNCRRAFQIWRITDIDICYAECDKIAKWQIFMSRYIFLSQVFYIHGKFLYIHVKNIYSLSMRLASYQMSFFYVNLRAQFLYIKKDWRRARAWLAGSLGTDRRRNNMAADNCWRVFRRYLVYFPSMHRMPGCA